MGTETFEHHFKPTVATADSRHGLVTVMKRLKRIELDPKLAVVVFGYRGHEFFSHFGLGQDCLSRLQEPYTLVEPVGLIDEIAVKEMSILRAVVPLSSYREGAGRHPLVCSGGSGLEVLLA